MKPIIDYENEYKGITSILSTMYVEKFPCWDKVFDNWWFHNWMTLANDIGVEFYGETDFNGKYSKLLMKIVDHRKFRFFWAAAKLSRQQL